MWVKQEQKITIFIGGTFAIPSHGWFLTLFWKLPALKIDVRKSGPVAMGKASTEGATGSGGC